MNTKEFKMATSAREFLEKKIGPMTIGKLIRSYRTSNELTAQAVAEILEVNRSFITNIENGRKHISLEMVLKIAKKLKESPELYALVWFEEEARRGGVSFEKIAKMRIA